MQWSIFEIILNLSEGVCQIEITDPGSNQRDILSTAIIGEYEKTIEAIISVINNKVTLDDLMEI